MNEEQKKKGKAGAGMEVDPSEEVTAEGAINGARLTERDRQLMGLLGLARHLSEAQVAEAMFPGLNLQNMRKRLRRLSGEGPSPFPQPYLRRVYYRALDSTLIPTWTLTPLGYRVAVEVAGSAAKPVGKDIDPRFPEQTITLNALLIHLAKKNGTGIAAPRSSRWQWIPVESVRLQWRDSGGDRVLVPDATLELPEDKKRFFFEDGTGTRSLRASSEERMNAILAKVGRYETYLEGVAATRPDGSKLTSYESSYPDRWKPEVLFLVHHSTQKAAINEAIASRHQPHRSPCRALTLEEANQEICALVHGSSPGTSAPASVLALKSEELKLLQRFYSSSIRALQEARARARLHQLERPHYPAESSEVQALLNRLARINAGTPSPGAP